MAIGAGLVSPPISNFNTMNALTTKYLSPVMGDATFIPDMFYREWLREGVTMESASIPFAVASSQDTSGGVYYGAQLLNPVATDNVTPAEQQWKFYRQPFVIIETDLLLNYASNPKGVLNLLTNKMLVGAASFLMLLQKATFGDTSQAATLRVDDIISWLVTSTNTIAGIDRTVGANSFWLPNTSTNANMGGATTLAKLITAYWSYVGNNLGTDEPQIFVMPPLNYATFESLFVQNIRYINEEADKRSVQGSLRHKLLFNNCVCIPSYSLGQASANTGLLINYNYIYPVYFEPLYFNFRPWLTPTNQFVMVSYCRLGWNIVCVSPQKAGQQIINMS